MKYIIALLLYSSSISGVKINSHNKNSIVTSHKIRNHEKGIFTNYFAEVQEEADGDAAEKQR